MQRASITIVVALLGLALAFAACGDDGDASDHDTQGPDVTSPYLPDTFAPDATGNGDGGDVNGEDAPPPRFPGEPCDSGDQCSTGYCYGKATNQGFFEQSLCQVNCIGLEDFAKYCVADGDCCQGRCCVGCGWRQGLCVLD